MNSITIMSTKEHTSGTPFEPTALPVIAEYIGVREGYCGGKPHVLGHRVKVKRIAEWRVQLGMSPSRIVEAHPTLSRVQVHAALAYFHDHQAEIEREMAEEDDLHERLKRERPSILEAARSRKAEGSAR